MITLRQNLMRQINIIKVRGSSVIPEYKSNMAAGLDLHADIETPLTIWQNQRVLVPTGIRLEFGTDELMAVIVPRSGLGHKEGLVVGNLVGVIDPDYTGEIMVSLWFTDETRISKKIKPGDRIAQMIFLPFTRVLLNPVDQFTETSRGSNGFGSTGTS